MKTGPRQPGRRRTVTIREVAERAGVSQMTVSRVLNKRDLVREATTQRVEEAIRELNYRPNVMARRLAGGHSLTVGFVYYNPSKSYLGEMLRGALDACRDLGHYLLVNDVGVDDATVDPVELIERSIESGVDGLVVCPPLSEDESIAARLRNESIKVVRIAPGLPTGDPHVKFDYADGADAMTRYLIDRGHRKIAFIKGAESHQASHLRLAGFRRAMNELGVYVPASYIEGGAYTFRSGMECMTRLLALADRPTAVFASNDDMAAGALMAAHRLGLSVPEDLSVAGFDDTEIGRVVWPALTTVRIPIMAMGRRAIEILDQESRKTTDETGVELRHEIVERESVAAPKASDAIA